MEMDLAPLQVYRDMKQFTFQTHMGHSCKVLEDMSNKKLELLPKALKKFSNSALEVIQYATKIIIIDLTFLAHNYPVDYDDSKL